MCWHFVAYVPFGRSAQIKVFGTPRLVQSGVKGAGFQGRRHEHFQNKLAAYCLELLGAIWVGLFGKINLVEAFIRKKTDLDSACKSIGAR